MENNRQYHFANNLHEACFNRCHDYDPNFKSANFLTMRSTLCFRNCINKTKSCFYQVMSNVDNSGAAFYQEQNEKRALEKDPLLAAAVRDEKGEFIDEYLKINTLRNLPYTFVR